MRARYEMLDVAKGMLMNQMRLVRDRIVLERISARYEGCRIDPRAIIRKPCHLSFGKNVVIGAYTVILLEPREIKGPEDIAVLTVGDDTYMGEFNNIRVEGQVRIGAKCLIAQGVSIIGSNYSLTAGVPIVDQPKQKGKLGVTIGDDVWIGANATILPGVTIGNGAVVAAGAVVTHDVECNTVVAGNPAKMIKVRG